MELLGPKKLANLCCIQSFFIFEGLRSLPHIHVMRWKLGRNEKRLVIGCGAAFAALVQQLNCVENCRDGYGDCMVLFNKIPSNY